MASPKKTSPKSKKPAAKTRAARKPAARKAAARKPKAAARTPARARGAAGNEGDVIYSDVRREMRSRLLDRLLG
jgi:hypothetical protein